MVCAQRFHEEGKRYEGSFDRVQGIRGRGLVVDGDDDAVISTENSVVVSPIS